VGTREPQLWLFEGVARPCPRSALLLDSALLFSRTTVTRGQMGLPAKQEFQQLKD